MGRKTIYDRPLSGAERAARRREKMVSFSPPSKPALDAIAAEMGKTADQVACDVVEQWLASGRPPPPPPCTPSDVSAAAALDTDRMSLLERMADILNRADAAQLERVRDRIGFLDALIPPPAGQ